MNAARLAHIIRRIPGYSKERWIEWRYHRRAKVAARRVNRHLRGKRGLFIDLGSNIGQGFNYFLSYFPESLYDFVLVEPSPECAARIRHEILPKHPGIVFLQAAAGVSDGKAKLYGLVETAAGGLSQGASLLKEHDSAIYTANDAAALEVQTFSFTDFLKERSRSYSSIVIKMDIEGAEYGILDAMLREDAFQVVRHIFIEFHSQYMVSPHREKYEAIEDAIVKSLRNRKVSFTLWQ